MWTWLLVDIFSVLFLKEREVKPLSPAAEPQGATNLASALARALADRNRACHSEDDSSSTESNDDEWDD